MSIVALMYADWWEACCEESFASAVISVILFPAMIIAIIVGGGVHSAGQFAFFFGAAVEFVALWYFLRILIRKLTEWRENRTDAPPHRQEPKTYLLTQRH
jgi:hypothetical protein